MFGSIAAAGAGLGAIQYAMAEQARHQNRYYQNLYGNAFVPSVYGAQQTSRFSSTPCSYCKRTNQTPGHKSCDGCGAPR